MLTVPPSLLLVGCGSLSGMREPELLKYAAAAAPRRGGILGRWVGPVWGDVCERAPGRVFVGSVGDLWQ